MAAKTASRTANAARNMVWGLMAKAVNMLLPFVMRSVLIYKLGSQYLGLNTLYSSILTVLSLAELGFGTAVVYSLYKPLAHGDADAVCAIMNYYKRIYRIIGAVVLAMGLACMPLLPKLIKGSHPDDINIYALYAIYLGNTVLSYWLFAYKNCILAGDQRSDVTSKVAIFIVVLTNVLQIAVLLLFSSFYAYAILIPVMTIVSNVIRSVIVDRLYPQYRPHGDISREQRYAIRKQVIGLMIQKICGVTRNSFDSIVISAFIGLESVSIYGNYYCILSGVSAFAGVLATSMNAGVGNKIVLESKRENYADMLRFNFIYMMFSGLCTVFLVCLYQPFMLIWMGESMMFNTTDMLLMCLYFYVGAVGAIRYVYYEAAGLWWHGKWRAVAESVTNLALNFILGYYFGITGIIAATIISMFFINFLYGTSILYRYYFTEEKSRGFYLRHLLYFVVTGAAAAGCYFICNALPLGEGTGMRIVWILVRAAIAFVITAIVYYAAYSRSKEWKESKVWLLGKLRHVRAHR